MVREISYYFFLLFFSLGLASLLWSFSFRHLLKPFSQDTEK